MKVAIVGSREYARMDKVCDFVRSLPAGTTVVSGGARGVDSVAEEIAIRCGLDVVVFRADWNGLGKRAGFARNKTIVEAADRVVAFWDGVSRGTAHTINLARKVGKPVEVIISTERPKIAIPIQRRGL